MLRLDPATFLKHYTKKKVSSIEVTQLVNNDVLNIVNSCHLMLNCRILDLSHCNNISAYGRGGSNGWELLFTCPYTIHIHEMDISYTNITDIDVEKLADSYFFPNLKVL